MRVSFVVAVALATFSVGAVARAQSAEEAFDRGNAAYAAGRFDEAAEAYRTALRYGARDARVEYNLGNAEYKLGRLGEAILHYERASRLSPGDEDVAANLELARSRCVDRIEVPDESAIVRGVRRLQGALGADRQGVAFLIAFWGLAAVVVFGASRPGGFTPRVGWAIAALTLASSLVGASWWATWSRLDAASRAVVLLPAVEALAGPSETNAAVFTVHEGTTVEIRAEAGEWVRVELPNGLTGWVRPDALGRV